MYCNNKSAAAVTRIIARKLLFISCAPSIIKTKTLMNSWADTWQVLQLTNPSIQGAKTVVAVNTKNHNYSYLHMHLPKRVIAAINKVISAALNWISSNCIIVCICIAIYVYVCIYVQGLRGKSGKYNIQIQLMDMRSKIIQFESILEQCNSSSVRENKLLQPRSIVFACMSQLFFVHCDEICRLVPKDVAMTPSLCLSVFAPWACAESCWNTYSLSTSARCIPNHSIISYPRNPLSIKKQIH